MLGETHGTEGSQLAYSPPRGSVAFWAAGTAARAGVGIIVRQAFVDRFQAAPPCWEALVPGRLGRLRLVGADGCLDLFAAYFPSGRTAPLAGQAHQDGARPAPSLRRQRDSLRDVLKQHVDEAQALAIVGADFNFVLSPEDRWSKLDGTFSGAADAAEAQAWKTTMGPALYELFQPEPTHDGPISRGRLDRCFINGPPCDQLDRQV